MSVEQNFILITRMRDLSSNVSTIKFHKGSHPYHPMQFDAITIYRHKTENNFLNFVYCSIKAIPDN